MNQVLKDADGNFVLKIKAPPIDGKANEEVIRFLSSILKMPKSKITITAGLNNPFKKIEVQGISETDANNLLNTSIIN